MQHYIPYTHGLLKVYKSGGGGGGAGGDGGDDSMSQFFIINLLPQQPKGQLITKLALEHKGNTPVTNRI